MIKEGWLTHRMLMVSWIQVTYVAMLVYTPGTPSFPHPTPQLTNQKLVLISVNQSEIIHFILCKPLRQKYQIVSTNQRSVSTYVDQSDTSMTHLTSPASCMWPVPGAGHTSGPPPSPEHASFPSSPPAHTQPGWNLNLNINILVTFFNSTIIFHNRIKEVNY